MKQVITITHKKSTRGTEVYENPDYNLTFYVPKVLMQGEQPFELTLTIESKGETTE